MGTDMSPASVSKRLAIVDELREFAFELMNAKRLGKVETSKKTEVPSQSASDRK